MVRNISEGWASTYSWTRSTRHFGTPCLSSSSFCVYGKYRGKSIECYVGARTMMFRSRGASVAGVYRPTVFFQMTRNRPLYSSYFPYFFPSFSSFLVCFPFLFLFFIFNFFLPSPGE